MKELQIYDTEAVYDGVRLNEQMRTQFRPIHDAMTRNYNMTVSGMQWDEDIRRQLEFQNRPAYSYNIITNAIRFSKQLEEGGRKGVIAMPITEGDYDESEIISRLIMHFMKKTDFDYHRGRAFLDAIIARYGVVFNGWSYANNPQGSFVVQSIDPRRIMFDLDYSDATQKNIKFMQDRYGLTIEEIITKYAYENLELQDAVITEARPFIMNEGGEARPKYISSRLKSLFSAFTDVVFDAGRNTDNSNLHTRYSDWYNPQRMTFDVVETHEKRTIRRVLFYNPETEKQEDVTRHCFKGDGSIALDREKIVQIKENNGYPYDPDISLDNVLWLNAVIPALGVQVYDAPYPVQNGQFMFTLLFANNFHADMAMTQSIVDDLVDPQSDFNKARSTQLELLQRYVNSGWVVEDGAIDGFEEDWTTANLAPYRRVNVGYWGKIKPEERQSISPDLIREINQVPVMADFISNVNKAAKGQSEGAGESARHFMEKRQQTERSFSNLMGNLDTFSKLVYRNCLYNIQHFVKSERAFRIATDADKTEKITVNQKTLLIEQGRIIERVLNDVTVGEYDVEISNAPYSSTAREIEFMKFIEIFDKILQIAPQKAEQMIPILIKASDTSYRNEMMKALGEDEEGKQGANEQQKAIQMMQGLMQRLEVKGKELELQEKELSNLNKYLDAQKKKIEIKQSGSELINQLLGAA